MKFDFVVGAVCFLFVSGCGRLALEGWRGLRSWDDACSLLRLWLFLCLAVGLTLEYLVRVLLVVRLDDVLGSRVMALGV